MVTCQKLAQNEEVNLQMILSQRLSEGSFHTVPEPSSRGLINWGLCPVISVLASRNDLDESEDQMIAISMLCGGLKHSVHEKMPLHAIFYLADAIHMEKSVSSKSCFATTSTWFNFWDVHTTGPLPNNKDSKDKGPLLETSAVKPHIPMTFQAWLSVIGVME